MECNRCTDSDGRLSSDSCWDYSTTSSATNASTSCEYSWGDDDLICSTCSNTSGQLTNKNCWREYNTNSYNGEDYGATSEELANAGATCDYNETPSTDGYGSNWCEVCTSSNGEALRDTCTQGEEATYTAADSSDDQNDDHNNATQGGWCEYYATEDLSCKTCYGDDGNIEEESCEEVENVGGWCEWRDNGNGGGCNICYDSDDNVTEETCDEGNQVDDFEAKRQLKEMREQLRWKEHDLKEFSRFDKRIKRKIKEINRKIENIEEDIEWMQDDSLNVSVLKDIISQLNSSIKNLNKLAPSMTADQKAFQKELNKGEQTLKQVSNESDLSWDHLDAAWMMLRKSDVYQVKRDVYDGHLNFYDMQDNYYEWLKEKEKILAELDSSDIQLTSDQRADLEEGDAWVVEFMDLHDEFLDAAAAALSVTNKVPSANSIEELLDPDVRMDFREYFDFDLNDAWEDLRWARDGLNSHGWDNQILWESLEEIRHGLEAQHNMGWIMDEVKMIREDLNTFEKGLNAIDGQLPPFETKRLQELRNVLPKARSILGEIDEMMSSADSKYGTDPGDMEDLWGSLGRLNEYVEPRIEDLRNYVFSHWDDLNLNDQERDALKLMFRDDNHGAGDGGDYDNECRKCDRLYDVYTEDVANGLREKIKEEMINEMVTQIAPLVAEQVALHLTDELSGRMYEAIINNLDKLKGSRFGENFGNELLENGNKVTKTIGGVEIDDAPEQSQYREEFRQLKKLRDKFKKLPMPNDELATRVAAYWDSVQAALDRSPSKSELTTLLKEGGELLEEAIESKYVYHLGFKDVPYIFDDEYDEATHWYAGYVVEGALEGRWEGYKDSNGNPRHEFGPADPTLRAEAVKMVLAAFGYEPSGSGQSWWDGWANRGRDLGASLVNKDLSQKVTRGEVMRLIYEVGRFSPTSSFQSYYPDVTTNDDWQPAEAMFEAGIFTGDGNTGNARLYDSLNRAESAAVINRAAQWQTENEFLQEDLARVTLLRNTQENAKKKSLFTLKMALKALVPFY